jgi:galactokinase
VDQPLTNASALGEKFRNRFGTPPSVYRAPGRVNLIGEHTDYNDGFVLPAAIGFSCWVACGPRNDRKLIVYSENLKETTGDDLDALTPRGARKWSDYVLGVAWALEQAGHRLGGANLYVAGDVPLGAGLSSSAAIEVAVGLALLDRSHHRVELTKLARLCQRAENEYVGARSGIMDQFVSCHGRAGHALLLDCRSLAYEALPLPAGLQLVICNTMVKHEISGSEYNVRRAECEEGVKRLAKVLPGIRALRDVTVTQLVQHRGRLTETVYRRCRHVISENDRVLKAAQILRAGNSTELGPLLAESHRSLREDYQVSCSELDAMVEIASRQPGVTGARMTGGGFGGCTINLVATAGAARFQSHVAAEYEKETGMRPEIYVCEASQSAEVVVRSSNADWNEGQRASP